MARAVCSGGGRAFERCSGGRCNLEATGSGQAGIRRLILVGVMAWALGALGALGGCGSAVQRSAPANSVEVPSAWSQDTTIDAGTEALNAQWWLGFNDELMTSLVERALRGNTSIRSAQAALMQARALRDVSAAALQPILGGVASAQRSKSGDEGAVNQFRTGLDASWELDLFGLNRSALRASEATVKASVATMGNVRVSIAAETALSYVALRGSQARLENAMANLTSQRETLQITQWRNQAGLATGLETEQARAIVEQTSAQLPPLQTSIEQSSHALAVLTGQSPAALAQLLAPVRPVPAPAKDLALSIPAETLRQRPDVAAAEFQVTASVARLAQADAARAPSFKLNGSIGLNALTLGALTNGASVVSAILGSMSLPIFDGGAARAQIRAQQAALDQSWLAYQATVLFALQEVEDALVALRGDRERLARLRQAAQAAGNAALLARQRYSSGLVDFQVVLETQRTQLSTQDGVATAQADVSADHLRLYKALGGGWRADAEMADVAMRPQGAPTLPIPKALDKTQQAKVPAS